MYTHFVKLEVCFYMHLCDYKINFNLLKFVFLWLFSNQKCACPKDKSCQRFTCPNQISTCPGQSDVGFGAPWESLCVSKW